MPWSLVGWNNAALGTPDSTDPVYCNLPRAPLAGEIIVAYVGGANDDEAPISGGINDNCADGGSWDGLATSTIFYGPFSKYSYRALYVKQVGASPHATNRTVQYNCNIACSDSFSLSVGLYTHTDRTKTYTQTGNDAVGIFDRYSTLTDQNTTLQTLLVSATTFPISRAPTPLSGWTKRIDKTDSWDSVLIGQVWDKIIVGSSTEDMGWDFQSGGTTYYQHHVVALRLPSDSKMLGRAWFDYLRSEGTY
jgi:hypothetical protein